MPKDEDKGLMHQFFGEELCDGCKGLLVVAFITPSQRDLSSFVQAFSKQQQSVDAAGQALAVEAAAKFESVTATPKEKK